ncbi:hypothetical protein [Leifsonia poae]|uniref:hypothetical protein n=1 Tax=Leifsonia poae TaxID=110933 RepID=UPI003D666EC0
MTGKTVWSVSVASVLIAVSGFAVGFLLQSERWRRFGEPPTPADGWPRGRR